MSFLAKRGEQGETLYSALFRSYLSKSFRDVNRVDLSDRASEEAQLTPWPGSPLSEETIDSLTQGHATAYHRNFLRCVESVGGAAPSTVNRVVDVKAISPSHDRSGEVGFALLCRTEAKQQAQNVGVPKRESNVQGTKEGYSGHMHCIVQLFCEVGERELPLDASPNPETSSVLSDGSQGSHGLFRPFLRWVVPLPDSGYGTRLHYVGEGVLLLIGTSMIQPGRIDYIDLHGDGPTLQRVNTEQRDIVSASVVLVKEGLSSVIVVSCLTRRSHFTVKLERCTVTPRNSAGLTISCSDAVEIGLPNSEQQPCHLPISAGTTLIFPAVKLGMKYPLLRVQGIRTHRERIELRCKISAALQIGTGKRSLVLVGTEDGQLAVLPSTGTSDGSSTTDVVHEVSYTRVFDGDSQQRTVVRLEVTSSGTTVVAFSRTSAVLFCVDDTGRISVLSRLSNAVATEFALLHVHLHREINGNPNFFLLSSEFNGTCVNLSAFHRMSSIVGSTVTPQGARDSKLQTSPPQSIGESQFPGTPPLPPSSTTGSFSSSAAVGGNTSSTPHGLRSLFASIKAKVFRQTPRSPTSAGAADFFLATVGEPITKFCEGYCRKSTTSVDDPHRLVALHPRLHAFLVWLRLHGHDEVLLLSDQSLHLGLSKLHREE